MGIPWGDGGRLVGQSRPKPHQCDIKATPMRVDIQPIATPKPPQSQVIARCKPGDSHVLSCVPLVLLLCSSCSPRPPQAPRRHPNRTAAGAQSSFDSAATAMFRLDQTLFGLPGLHAPCPPPLATGPASLSIHLARCRQECRRSKWLMGRPGRVCTRAIPSICVPPRSS